MQPVSRNTEARGWRSPAAWLPVLVILITAATPPVIEWLRGLEQAGSDIGTMFLPNWTWWWQRWRFGGGWNPWIFAGEPANADPLLSRFHPLSLLYAGVAPLAAAAIEGFLLDAISALGMYAYLRRLRCRRGAALLGALSFGLAGFTAGNAGHPPHLRSTMVIPWALLAIEALDGRALAAATAACVAAILLGGHPQSMLFSLLPIGAYAAWLGRPLRGGRLFALAGGALLGAGIAAVAWLPTLAFLGETTRVRVTPLFPNPTLTLREAWRLIAPFAGGSWPGGAPNPADAFRCGPAECAGYPGLVPLLIVATTLPLLARDPRGRFWSTMAVVGLIGSLGFGPQLTGLRGPARLLLWWNLAIAAATGIGFDAALRQGVLRSLARLATAVLALLAVSALLVSNDRLPLDALLPIALALAVAAGLLSAAGNGRTLASAALVLLLGLDLVGYQAVVLSVGAPAGQVERLREPLDLVAPQLRELPPDLPGAVVPGRVLFLPPPRGSNWAAHAGVPLVQGYNLLVLEDLARQLGQNVEVGLESVGEIGDASLAAPSSHVLDLLRVRLVVRDPAVASALGDAIARDAATPGSRWRRLPVTLGPRDLELYRNERARPLAWLVDETRAVPDGSIAPLVRGEGPEPFDPARQALFATGAGPEPEPAARQTVAEPTPASSVEVLRYADDAIELRVATPRAATLVLSEIAYPGWQAWIDGDVPVAVVTANGLQRALAVPPGRHQVTLRYRPTPDRVGLLITGLSLVGLLILIRQAWRPRGAGRARAGSR